MQQLWHLKIKVTAKANMKMKHCPVLGPELHLGGRPLQVMMTGRLRQQWQKHRPQLQMQNLPGIRLSLQLQ